MYKTSQQHVAVHDLLRAFAGRGVRLQIDCPPGLWIDTAATALALEEAMSNARKYGDEGSDAPGRKGSRDPLIDFGRAVN